MQFHLNGFKKGDPHIAQPITQDGEHVRIGQPSIDSVPSKVDVLIVGAGPAGLLLAAQLSQFSNITTRIVEQKPSRLELGQADGLACRTLEVFQAFGFGERVVKEAYWVNETTFWKPDPTGVEGIVRSGRIRDTEEGLSEFPHVILNQARVHDFFLDTMRNSPTRLEPNYSRQVKNLKVVGAEVSIASDKVEAPVYPVTVELERIDPGHEGEVEKVNAQYVVGCDGARSAVRRFLDLPLKGEAANQAWGVMDVLAVTSFPDIRFKTAIHSAHQGSILIIPREGGYLVRLYIELDKLNENERVATKNMTSDHLVSAAQRIFHPYVLEVKEVAWWSVYEIGQRLCERFDDVPAADIFSLYPHVFIAGDACHTHSPKAGQGMNVSMGDAYNLGWKLASVLNGHSSPKLLRTYSEERQAIAKELIDFDKEFARMFSARPRDKDNISDAETIDPAEFQRYFVKQGRFTAGTATTYQPSLITSAAAHGHLATGFPVGMRFHSIQAVRLTDAKPVHLGHIIKADGRWRIFIFGGAEDPTLPSSLVARLCDFLSSATSSPVKRYTPLEADIDSVIDTRAVLQQSHTSLDLQALPYLLRPAKGRYGLVDYEKVYCDEPSDSTPFQSIYDARSIDKEGGCMVVVRPDQYVATTLPLDDFAALSAFFDAFMTAPSAGAAS